MLIEDSFVSKLSREGAQEGQWRSLQPTMRLPLDPQLETLCCHVASDRDGLHAGNFDGSAQARPARCGDVEYQPPLDAYVSYHRVSGSWVPNPGATQPAVATPI